jgi:hypothetical protein
MIYIIAAIFVLMTVVIDGVLIYLATDIGYAFWLMGASISAGQAGFLKSVAYILGTFVSFLFLWSINSASFKAIAWAWNNS